MNLIALMRLPATVPNPPTGYAAIFMNSSTQAPNVKYADGTVSTLQGPTGATGATGTSASLSVGTVTALPAGSTPTVTNVGTTSAAILNFGLPIASLTRYTTAVPFTDQGVVQYVTVTNAAVTATNFPTSLTIYAQSADSNSDYGYCYNIVVVQVLAGSFTVRITAYDPNGTTLEGLTLPPVVLQYLV